MFPRIFLTIFFGFSLLVLPVHAQESVASPENLDGDEVSFTVADINLGDVVVNEQDGTFSGTFSLFGTLTQNRIVTSIIVTNDKGEILDVFPLEKDIVLKQGELKTYSFSYQIPDFLSGKFTVYVRAETVEGLPLGMQKVGGKDLPVKENPVNCKLIEEGKKISCAGPGTVEVSYHVGSLSLPPMKTETLSLPNDFTPDLSPGRYFVVVKNLDTKAIHVLPFYVTGTYGQIENALFQRGDAPDTLRLTVSTFISSFKGAALDVTLKDSQGNICIEKTLSSGPIFDVSLSTTCREGVATLTLKGEDGSTLATLTDPFFIREASPTETASGTAPPASSHMFLLVFIIALIVLILLVTLFFVKRKKNLPPSVALSLVFLFALTFGLFGMAPKAEALTISANLNSILGIGGWSCTVTTSFTRASATYDPGELATFSSTAQLWAFMGASNSSLGTCSGNYYLDPSGTNVAFDGPPVGLGVQLAVAGPIPGTFGNYATATNSKTFTVPSSMSSGSHRVSLIETRLTGGCIFFCSGGGLASSSGSLLFTVNAAVPTVTVTPYTYQNSSGGGFAFAGEYYGLLGYGLAHISWTSTGGATSCSVRRDGTTVATGLGANSSYNIPSGEAINELSVTYTVTCTNGTNSGSGTATFTRPPDPLSVSISCSADGTVGTVTWTGPPGWNLFYVGKADAAGGGNIGPDYGGYTGTSTTFPTTPGHSYYAWVHTEGLGGQWSNPIYTSPYPSSVTCVAPTASFTPVSSPTCYVPYATRGCNLILYWTSANVSSVDLKDCGGGLYGNFGSGNRSWMVYSPGGNPTGGGCYRIHNHADNAILAQIGTTNICASNLVYDVTALPPDGDPYLGRCVCSPGSSWDNGSSSCVASTASFTATPGCTIGPGASSCNTVLGWTSANIANVKLTDCSGTTSYGTFGSGSQSGTVSVPYNSGCYQIRKQSDNSIISTANAVIPSSCGGGSVWNGTRCNLASGLLTVSLAGTGSGSISSAPAGVSCGVDCTENYPLGTDVILTATPVLGSVFTGWSGDCSGNGTCTLTMNMAHVVTATFTVNPAELYPVNLSRSGNLTQGSVLTFNVSVTNQGFSAAPSSNVRFCMDNASCSTSTTGQLGADAGTGAIPVGALSGSISQAWTATTQGNHTLYVCADAGNLVHEQNEGNNCIRLNFSVSPAPPSLTCS